MTLSNFQMPIDGVTGPAFRNNLSLIVEALASSNRGTTDPPQPYAGMLQAYSSGGVDSLRYYTTSDTWVTLLPNLSQEYGGLGSVISAASILPEDNIFTGRNEFQGQLEVGGAADFNSTANFDGAVTFNGNVSFASNPGFSTSATVAAQIDSALSGLLRRRNSFSRTPNLNSTDQFAHGLGKAPDFVECLLQFRQNVANYDVGHIIKLPLTTTPAYALAGSTATPMGVTVRYDSTNIQVALASAIPVVNRSNNQVFLLNNSSMFELQFVVYTVD